MLLLLFSDVAGSVEIVLLSQCSHSCWENSFRGSQLICKHLLWNNIQVLQGELKMYNNS